MDQRGKNDPPAPHREGAAWPASVDSATFLQVGQGLPIPMTSEEEK